MHTPMNLNKAFKVGSSLYLLLFLLDYLIELFSISSSTVKTALLGLKITMKMSPATLDTVFSLTWQVLLTYLIFMIIFFTITYLFQKTKRKRVMP
ncbi:hypothetical protein KIM322_00290 [Lactobacillus xylocopicola]|uniref:Uncharacterized protein n=1 Tax=Lactobacillus xylocopicola TaxID=2976676 RepID=A0ABM8BEY0_9LACO|nr:hypothetical protein KIM322_00290 [Lactobacillus xylocopicola]